MSSDQETLSALYQSYGWIPNSDTIRPLPAVIELKNATLLEIEEKWFSLKDYILFKVFSMEYDQIAGRCVVMKAQQAGLIKVFQPNEFPYNIDCGNHWVMWYNTDLSPYGDDAINADIDVAICKHLNGASNYDFVWYENPKMSVPDFFHVQVFWVVL